VAQKLRRTLEMPVGTIDPEPALQRRRTGVRAGVIAFLIVAAGGLLYGHRLDYAPPHIQIDEVLIALDAHAIATTGRDMRGELLPLYSQTAEHSWYQPFVIYLTALALKVLPFTEWAIRLPTVCIAVLNVVLMYFVARRLFASGLFGTLAAGLLLLSPAHFIHSRYGMDYIYPLPFILGWLLCLSLYHDRRRAGFLVFGTSLLGIGFYSYIASIVMMPVYLALTCLLLYHHAADRRTYSLAAAGFLPWLVPFLVWLARHPEAYGATIEKYGLYDAQRLDAMQGLRSVLGYSGVAQRLSQYWNFYNPSFLFFGSGTKLMFSTNLAGVFLLATAVFLAIGIYRAATDRANPVTRLVLLGFVTAPLAALVVAEENAIFRALALVPFGVLLATLGAQHMWSGLTSRPLRVPYRMLSLLALAMGGGYAAWTLMTRSRMSTSPVLLALLGFAGWLLGRIADPVSQWRVVAACLLAFAPIQFAGFWTDYFSDYRIRSAYWLGGNIGGALEAIIERDRRSPAPAVYFSTLKATSGQVDGRDQYMPAYWKFHLVKHHREDLLARTKTFDAANVHAMPRGSLVLANEGDVTTGMLVRGGELREVATIPELNGASFFAILER
jgi:4-amino-4-deoxy-L-arabinose transferase-like glycosyltransferase